MYILGLFCGVRVQFQRELTLDVQGLEQVGQSAKYLAAATRPRCGGSLVHFGPFSMTSISTWINFQELHPWGFGELLDDLY